MFSKQYLYIFKDCLELVSRCFFFFFYSFHRLYRHLDISRAIIAESSQETETTTHPLLHCSSCHCARQNCFQKINGIDSSILYQNETSIIKKDALFGSKKLESDKNKSFLLSAIDLIHSMERLKFPLLPK